jgi:hypothetical protein
VEDIPPVEDPRLTVKDIPNVDLRVLTKMSDSQKKGLAAAQKRRAVEKVTLKLVKVINQLWYHTNQRKRTKV